MTILFTDPFLDDFGVWPLAYAPYGGSDFGELAAIAAAHLHPHRARRQVELVIEHDDVRRSELVELGHLLDAVA